MQLHLFPIILILHITEYTDFLQRVVAQLRDHPGTPEEFCGELERDRGCLTCSRTNGCLTCKPRYFFLLVRHDMRQTGLCLLSCPNGYYHTRSRDVNKCMKCHLDCDCNFTGTFCTRCREGQYLHRGKCHRGCPEGLVPDSTLWECIPAKVYCEVNEWSTWSACSHRGSTCGFRAGEQTRVRRILQLPSNGGNPCSVTYETRECFIRRKKCPAPYWEQKCGQSCREPGWSKNMEHLGVLKDRVGKHYLRARRWEHKEGDCTEKNRGAGRESGKVKICD
nr:R-spondin-3-like isoform X2 [Paramormyrops kingsleyae]